MNRTPSREKGASTCANLCKVLSDPTRVTIMRYLVTNSARGMTPSQLQKVIPRKKQSNISHHLGVIKRAGYVSTQMEHTNTFYQPTPAFLRQVNAFPSLFGTKDQEQTTQREENNQSCES